MKEAVIYARVSSKDQEREGYSIPAQRKTLMEYAPKNGFRIVREFVDVETAKCAGREQFGEMIAFLRNNQQCRTVIVEKTDRLYRNFRDYLTLEDLGVEIHLAKEGQIINKDSKSQAKFMHGIQVLMARNYIDNLREEVCKGMREKAEQGIYPSRPPLGYRNNKLERTIEVDPEKAPIARNAFLSFTPLVRILFRLCAKQSLLNLAAFTPRAICKNAQKSFLHRACLFGRERRTRGHTLRLFPVNSSNRSKTFSRDITGPNTGSINLHFPGCFTVRTTIAE